MTAPRKLLTVDQVAEHLSLSRWAVINHIAAWVAGDPAGLPATNVGRATPGKDGKNTGVRYRIDPDDLDRWKKSRRVAA